jgi:hypothetical protein
MRRRILIAVLALGTVLGFGAGFAHLRWRGACGHHGRYGSAAFEERVSAICADAAMRVQRERERGAAAAAPHGGR